MERLHKIATRVALKTFLTGSSNLPQGEGVNPASDTPVSGFSSFREEPGKGEVFPSEFDTLEEDQETIKDPRERIDEIEVKPSFQFNIPIVPDDVRR